MLITALAAVISFALSGVIVLNALRKPRPSRLLGCVIPKPRAFTSGVRDLARITTAVRKHVLPAPIPIPEVQRLFHSQNPTPCDERP